MIGITQWLIRHRFRKAISHMEQEIKQTQEFIDFCDANSKLLFEDENDWVISKSEIIENIDKLIAALAQLDQLQTKYK
jgi:hypothetical protein